MPGAEPGGVARLAQGRVGLAQGRAGQSGPRLAFNPLLPQLETPMYRESRVA